MRSHPPRLNLRKPLVGLLTAALLLGSAPAPTQSLPSLGDAGELPLSTERQLGDRIMREIYRDVDYLDDPVLTEYVRGIWSPLRRSARLRGEMTPEMAERFAWGVLLVRDRSVNAFALPGGYMGVNLGLIMLVNSRDELASVLAHELSHVTQRHISRSFTQQSRTAPLMIAALVVAILAASKNPKVTEAMIATSQAAAVQSQLNFSRDMEREADRVGFGLMEPSGYQPQAFVSMFELLQRASRLNDNGNYPYLRSHPLTSERIADMQLRLGLEPGLDAGPSPASASAPSVPGPAFPAALASAPAASTSSSAPARAGIVLQPVVVHGSLRLDWLQHLMAARSRILVETNPDGWRRAIAELQGLRPSPTLADAARQAGMLYAAALAAIKLRQFDQALPWIQQLREQVKADAEAARAARWLQAEWAVAAQRPEQALALVKADSGDRVDLLLAAQAALQLLRQRGSGVNLSPHPRDALSPARIDSARPVTPPPPWAESEQRLLQWVQDQPGDAPAWEALAALAQARGEPLRALRAEAEVRAAQYNLPAAIDRLRAAQELARKQRLGQQADSGTHIDLSIIDTRLRALQAQLLEQQRELTGGR